MLVIRKEAGMLPKVEDGTLQKCLNADLSETQVDFALNLGAIEQTISNRLHTVRRIRNYKK